MEEEKKPETTEQDEREPVAYLTGKSPFARFILRRAAEDAGIKVVEDPAVSTTKIQ